jgi:hypothetical protein
MGPAITLRIGATEILDGERLRGLEELIGLFREMDLDGEIAYRPPAARSASWYEVTAIYLGAKGS